MLRCAVVEDEILIRRNMVKKIKACGADIEVVCEAGNGRDALAYIRKREVDLVVTDIQMPILDGLSLARALAEEFPEVIVVIVSGFDNFTYAQQAIRYHVFDYLLKPVQADLLMETINGVRVKVQVREQDAYEKEAEQKKQNAQRGVGTEEKCAAGTKGADKTEPEAGIRAIQRYIQEHYAEDIQIAELAEKFHFSNSYVGSAFKKQLGITPLQYLIYLRINEAKKLLLKYPERPVAEIGKQVGYDDPYYFSRIFKKQTGISPSSYHAEQNEGL